MTGLSRISRGLAVFVLAASGAGASGCINDPDCGICDPHNLILESISGVNYTGDKVHILSPACEGERCPGQLSTGSYFIEDIGPCEETDEALASQRGPEEYCRISPLMSAFGIEFVFNNLLEPSSVELVRRRPDNPNLFEVYDWKTQVLQLEGPITRYNGDYTVGRGSDPDLMTRLVNLTCIDNLRAQGRSFSHADYEDPASNPCNVVDPATGQPMKLQSLGTITSSRGRWDSRAIARGAVANCDTPEDGPDTCCNYCDFALSTKIARYGVLSSDPAADGATLLSRANQRRPSTGTAIECDPMGDRLLACRDFQVGVDRDDETHRFDVWWSCPPDSPGCTRDTTRAPAYDLLRQTHPDDRPAWLEAHAPACSSTTDCQDYDGSGLVGTECVGTNADGDACSLDADDPECTQGRCRAPWFVRCEADPDTTGPTGYCVDRRFDGRGAAACLEAQAEFRVCNEDGGGCQLAPAGFPIAYCDWNEDRRFDAFECCQQSLGATEDGAACDPMLQSALAPVARYDRNRTLPDATRECVCAPLSQVEPQCEQVVAASCLDENGDVRPGRLGEYAVKFVTREGGVIYDPAIKGLEWRPADRGAIPRAGLELCAEDRGLIAARNAADGWRAHDDFDQQAETFEDFDRGLCSGQTYTVRFTEPSADAPVEAIADKLGNTLAGRSVYTLQTPDFHVVPDSGFPTDNLRIGACQDLSLRFSNKFDMSPENLAKVEVWHIDAEGNYVPPFEGCALGPVAGGASCATTDDERQARGECTPPCLVADVAAQETGQLGIRIDPGEFGAVLRIGERYRVWVPGLASADQMSDPAAYAGAFWDVCGMPLVLGTDQSATEYTYDFTIDEPKCKEDEDADNVQLSCDNAPAVFNPEQTDADHDGIGDVVDLCPMVAGASSNSADSDKDGVGNECDRCRQTVNQYNEDDDGVPDYMLVRGNPVQRDTDGDGIGDACDNCVVTANCEDYGPDKPWRLGDPIAYEDAALCQRDDDSDMIGDACVGQQGPGAIGPVGYGPDDDFDQDGLANAVDACPRIFVVDPVACETDDDCPSDRACQRPDPEAPGACNHPDSDGDTIGDLCDTCPFTTNPMQRTDGFAQEDDADGDFVGQQCETVATCADRNDPRPLAFYEVAVGDRCCTVQLVETPEGLINAQTGRPLRDPDGIPIFATCDELDELSGTCRPLPASVASMPGVLEPPPGCEEALADAGYASAIDNPALVPADFDGDLDALWGALCFLPQRDQDYDGLGDDCDLCTFAFDPQNLAFIDVNGKLWPRDGRYCNGDYSPDNVCAALDGDEPDGTGTGTGGETGDDSGGEDSGGDSTGGGTG